MKLVKSSLLHIGLLLTGILVEQLVKLVVLSSLVTKQKITLIPELLELKIKYNFGTIGGFGANIPILGVFVNLVGIILVSIFYLFSHHPKTKILFVIMMIGGGSNFIDRIWRGYVVDYIKISFFNIIGYYNLGDFLVIVASILLLVILIRHQTGRTATNEQSN